MRWFPVVLAGAALFALSGFNPATASPLGRMYASEVGKAGSDVVLVHRWKKKHYHRRYKRQYSYRPYRYYRPYGYYYNDPHYYGRRYYRRPGVTLHFGF